MKFYIHIFLFIFAVFLSENSTLFCMDSDKKQSLLLIGNDALFQVSEYLSGTDLANYLKTCKQLHSFAYDKSFIWAQLKKMLVMRIGSLWSLAHHYNVIKKIVLEAHEGKITSLAKIDNTAFLTGSNDKTAKIWKLTDSGSWTENAILSGIDGHDKAISAVAAIDDTMFITGSLEGTTKIWRLEGDHGICSATLGEHSDSVVSVLVINQKTIATGAADNMTKIWRSEDGNQWTCSTTLTGHKSWVRSQTCVTPTTFITGSDDYSIRIIRFNEAEQWMESEVIQGLSDWVTAIATINEHMIVTGFRDGALAILHQAYDVPWKIASIFQAHDQWISSIIMLNKNTFASGSHDGTVKIWHHHEHGSWQHLATMNFESPVTALTMINPGILAIGLENTTVEILKLPPLEQLLEVILHQKEMEE